MHKTDAEKRNDVPSQVTAVAESIGAEVRRARKRRGLDQSELAFVAAVNTRTVSQIENGKPTTRLDVMVRVLDALGLELTVKEASRLAVYGRRKG